MSAGIGGGTGAQVEICCQTRPEAPTCTVPTAILGSIAASNLCVMVDIYRMSRNVTAPNVITDLIPYQYCTGMDHRLRMGRINHTLRLIYQ